MPNAAHFIQTGDFGELFVHRFPFPFINLIQCLGKSQLKTVVIPLITPRTYPAL